MSAERLEAADLEAWRRFIAERAPTQRDRLFAAYLPYAYGLAARFRKARSGRDIELDDLRQYAAEGLLQAIDRYDPEQGAPFESFAARRIFGQMTDGLARSTEYRQQIAVRSRTRAERLASLTPASPPQDGALAALADLAIELALGFLLDEEGAVIGGQAPASHEANAYQSLAWSQTVSRVAAAVRSLPDPDGAVVRLHYLEGLEFARIAERLALSRGRVSQIHASALSRLRRRLPRADHLSLSQR